MSLSHLLAKRAQLFASVMQRRIRDMDEIDSVLEVVAHLPFEEKMQTLLKDEGNTWKDLCEVLTAQTMEMMTFLADNDMLVGKNIFVSTISTDGNDDSPHSTH